jgi:hypothetical protein
LREIYTTGLPVDRVIYTHKMRFIMMDKHVLRTRYVRVLALALGAGLLLGTGSAFADPSKRYYDSFDRREYRDDRHHRDQRYWPRGRNRHEEYRFQHHSPNFSYRGKVRMTRPDRVRWYRNVVIRRPHGHWYRGYAHYYRDNDAYKWLAFTAITLGILDLLNEEQQREHEAAQIAATNAPVGERITWSEGRANGMVVATREGTSTSGRYCREFQQRVSIGGNTEEAYGTACRQPDGSWEVVAVDNY